MTFDQFITKWNGKPADYDGYYGNQCVDLIAYYTDEVFGCKGWHANANEIYEDFPAPLPSFFNRIPADWEPKKGDIVVWGESIGKDGHTAIYIRPQGSGFVSFDQNWKVGTYPHEQLHTTQGVIGYLRSKKGEQNMPYVEQAILDDLENWKLTGQALSYDPAYEAMGGKSGSPLGKDTSGIGRVLDDFRKNKAENLAKPKQFKKLDQDVYVEDK